jgi:XTP/dITP diphosphohydrolase
MSFPLENRFLFFATNNINKFNEARKILAEYRIAVGMLRAKTLEIQGETLEEIACASAEESFRECHLPIVVEDAGLFIRILNGFPGPYAAYVYKTIGNKGLLKIMRNVNEREAKFESAVAYRSASLNLPVCFKGNVTGEITLKECRRKDNEGFGFDPIFKPLGSHRTFAEMPIEEKNNYSHRAMALRCFAQWHKERFKPKHPRDDSSNRAKNKNELAC